MKKKMIPVIVAVALIILIVCIAGGKSLFERFAYSKEYRDLNSYFDITNASDVAIDMNHEIIDTKAKMSEGSVYLDYSSVCSLLNSRFYVDEHESLLIMTTSTDVIKHTIGTNSYIMGGEEKSMEAPVTMTNGDTLYINLDYVKLFTNLSYEVFHDPERIVLRTSWGNIKLATIKKNTAVRYQGGYKSDILRDLEKEEVVTILEEMEDWDKVETADGIIGYVEKRYLADITETEEIPVTDYQDEFVAQTRDYKINMSWHAIYATSGNDTFDEVVNGTGTMSIICPTWFTLSDNDGNYRSFASSGYVEKAHSRNMEVWPTVDNFNIEGIKTYEVMSYTSKRDRLVSALMSEALSLGIDGFNLDFELVPTEAVPHYVQFIRELSVACRREGLVLSVDNYPPQGGSNYNLSEQGVFCDYVVIMGYDEHWAGCNEAGSVASIGYVEDGINLVIGQGVPENKIINAIPFYTRLWKTNNGEVTSEALDMTTAANFISNNSVPVSWDEVTCQNYGEKEMNGILYQMWLEDAQSIETKLTVMSKYNLAGVASWRLGHEDKSIWSVIDAYVKR